MMYIGIYLGSVIFNLIMIDYLGISVEDAEVGGLVDKFGCSDNFLKFATYAPIFNTAFGIVIILKIIDELNNN